MAADSRMNLDFIVQFLDVLERHGYHYHDDLHTDKAVGLLRDVARIYEGTQETPAGTHLAEPPSAPQPETRPPGPHAGQNAVILPASQAGIIAAALDEAAEYKRDRAETCADCADQSCPTCQWRLRGAETYGHLATQMLQAAQASRAAGSQPTPGSACPALRQPEAAAGREAGQ